MWSRHISFLQSSPTQPALDQIIPFPAAKTILFPLFKSLHRPPGYLISEYKRLGWGETQGSM